MRSKPLSAACAAALSLGLAAPTAAQTGPDLIIVQSDSEITPVSCEKNQPLATGRIVIKNQGDDTARMKLGFVDRLSRSLVAVYVPEHLDLKARAYELTILGPRDQESVRISLGDGVLKEGRFTNVVAGPPLNQYGGGYTPPSAPLPAPAPQINPNALLNLSELTLEDIQDIQRALQSLGYYRGSIDGVIGSGGRRAIRRLQRDLSAFEDGELTVGQVQELERRTGIFLQIGSAGFVAAPPPTPSYSAVVAPTPTYSAAGQGIQGPRTYRVTLYAVVDPYNVVDEIDERNNLVKFQIDITCGS